MKNVKNANFWQIDHRIKKIEEKKGIVVLSSPEAWKKIKLSREYFEKKPKEGYFIWVKKQVNFPLFTCLSIATKRTRQDLQNLLIIEKNLKISLQGTCNALKKNLAGFHKAEGKIILKENSVLKYEHFHSWGQEDVIEPNYEFILEKNSKLDYFYKNPFTPKKLKINTIFSILGNSSCNVEIFINCLKTQAEIKDSLILKEKGASGTVKLRLVGRKDSKISACSQILAEAESKGHLDCQGLLVDDESEILLRPELVCKNKKAQVTHEASIGRISEEQLSYLRMRGLSEREAINLIVSGFFQT